MSTSIGILISLSFAFGTVSFIICIYLILKSKLITKKQIDQQLNLKAFKDSIVECHECGCLVSSNTADNEMYISKYKHEIQTVISREHGFYALKYPEPKIKHVVRNRYFCKHCWNEKQRKETKKTKERK